MSIARLLFVLILLGLSQPAAAVRCGSKLVNEGDPKAKVLKHCGEPVSVERRTVVRSGVPRLVTRTRGFSDERELLLPTRSFVEVNIEEWTFNFGPRKFMRVIRFENGRVKDIEALSYGYRD